MSVNRKVTVPVGKGAMVTSLVGGAAAGAVTRPCLPSCGQYTMPSSAMRRSAVRGDVLGRSCVLLSSRILMK